jgi:hypothetical protein
MTRLNTRATDWGLCIIALATVAPTALFIESGLFARLERGLSIRTPAGAEAFLLLSGILLPAPIRYRNWRRALILCAVAGCICLLKATMDGHVSSIPYPVNFVAWDAILIGVGYWVATPPLDLRVLGFTIALTAAVAFTLPCVVEPVRYMHRVMHIPIAGGERITDLTFTLYWSLMAICTWLAIVAARFLSDAQHRATFLRAGIAVCVPAAWFLIFFEIAVFEIAARSLKQGWPLDRDYAARILMRRHDAATDELLWEAIRSADWTARPADDELDDYRRTCILVLDEHAPASTAPGLDMLLRQRPSFWLADDSALILAREHRYNAAPELMRYALLDANQSTSALEQMGIPQAAMAVLHEQISTETMITGRPETMGAPIEPYYERRLARLLGVDAGTKLSDWFALYDKVVDKRPTPLSIQQASETDRVVRAFFAYWSAFDQLQRIGRLSSIPAPDFNVPGTTALENEVQRYASAALVARKR